MTSFEIRRQRLSETIRDDFNGNQSKFAEKVGLAPNYISRLLGGKKVKNMSFEMADEFGKLIGKPKFWFETLNGEMSDPWPFAIPYKRFNALLHEQKLEVERELKKIIFDVENQKYDERSQQNAA